MMTLEFIFGAIKSLNLTALACIAIYILWKMDKRLAGWDKKISVKAAQCDGHFVMVDQKLDEHGRKITEYGRRINDVEDKILVIRSGNHGMDTE